MIALHFWNRQTLAGVVASLFVKGSAYRSLGEWAEVPIEEKWG